MDSRRLLPIGLRRTAWHGTRALYGSDGYQGLNRGSLDDDRFDRHVVTIGLRVLHLANHVQAVDYLSKDHVMAIQPRGGYSRDEELRAVRVLSSVGHAERARSLMLQGEGFIVEVAAVDADRATTFLLLHVTALNHEVLDDPVEADALVLQALVAFSGESDEIAHSPWGHFPVKAEYNATSVFITDGDVKRHLVGNRLVRLSACYISQ